MTIPGAIYADGKVILRYYQPIPKTIKVKGIQYSFDCRHGVSLLFVDEELVPDFLSIKGGCCNGQRLLVSLANQATYSHWKDGNGGR